MTLTIDVFEPRRQKTGLQGLRPGPTQTRLYSLRRWLEAWNFGFGKQRDCTIQVAKTKALISFTVTAKLICVFVFKYAKIRFSHVAAHLISAEAPKTYLGLKNHLKSELWFSWQPKGYNRKPASPRFSTVFFFFFFSDLFYIRWWIWHTLKLTGF